MINSALYREPVLLDSVIHRSRKMAALTDYSIARSLHAVFVAGAEFTQAALEYPLVFVRSGDTDASGKAMIAPVAMLGLSQGENLFVEGERWVGRYLPAFIRRYPFLTAQLQGTDSPGVLIDAAWSGLSDEVGEPLFDAAGKPAAALTTAIQFLEMFDAEALRTRNFCSELLALDILQEMNASATLPDGAKFSVDGFYVVDEAKLRALPDPTVVSLHRSGILTLLSAHLISLANIRHLLDRKTRRVQMTAEVSNISTPGHA